MQALAHHQSTLRSNPGSHAVPIGGSLNEASPQKRGEDLRS